MRFTAYLKLLHCQPLVSEDGQERLSNRVSCSESDFIALQKTEDLMLYKRIIILTREILKKAFKVGTCFGVQYLFTVPTLKLFIYFEMFLLFYRKKIFEPSCMGKNTFFFDHWVPRNLTGVSSGCSSEMKNKKSFWLQRSISKIMAFITFRFNVVVLNMYGVKKTIDDRRWSFHLLTNRDLLRNPETGC